MFTFNVNISVFHLCVLQNECVRMVVLGQLKTLTYLDDVFVMEEEAAAAVQVAARSRINQVWTFWMLYSVFVSTFDLDRVCVCLQASLMTHSRTDSERPRSLSLLSSAHLLTQISPSPWKHSQELESGWTTKVWHINSHSLTQTTCKRVNSLTLVISVFVLWNTKKIYCRMLRILAFPSSVSLCDISQNLHKNRWMET